VSDTLPAGLGFVSATGAGWTVNVAGQVITATHPGPIAPGDSLTLSVDVLPGAAAVPGVVNSASTTVPGDPDPANDTASDPTVVAGAPDLQTVKRGAGPFTVGVNGTYSITVTNVGSAAT